MKMLLGPDGFRYATLVECSDEIGEKMQDYFCQYLDSDMHRATWGAEDLVEYIQREIRGRRDLYIKILDPWTDQYEGQYPKLGY